MTVSRSPSISASSWNSINDNICFCVFAISPSSFSIEYKATAIIIVAGSIGTTAWDVAERGPASANLAILDFPACVFIAPQAVPSLAIFKVSPVAWFAILYNLSVEKVVVVVTVCSAGISEETPAPKDDSFPIGTLIVFLFSRDDLASNRSSSVTSDILPDSSLTFISSLFVFIVFSIIWPHRSSIIITLNMQLFIF